MKNIESDYEKGPAIFKEEIFVEDTPILHAEQLPTESTGTFESKSESGPKEVSVVPDSDDSSHDKVGDRAESPEAMPDIVADILINEPEIIDIKDDHDGNYGEVLNDQEKSEMDVQEEYGYRIPFGGYAADRQYGLDLMSVRTEDEVSELPDSEIASLISDRRPELERRDSDVSLSDREYSDKDDENVIISDSDEDDKPTFMDKKEEKTGYFCKEPEEKSDSGVSDKTNANVVAPTAPATLDDSFEESESLGAIPARVYGLQYLEEINKFKGQPLAAELDSAGMHEVRSEDIVKPHVDLQASLEEKNSEGSSSDSEVDKDALNKTEDEFKVPRLKLEKESSDSESDIPRETDESNLNITTDLETTVDLEGTFEREKTPDDDKITSDRDTPSKTTDDDSSTIKEEFMTQVDSLDMKLQQPIQIKEYVSSSEDEVPRIQPGPYGLVRSDSPVYESGLVDDMELSRITEEAEPDSDETSDTDSSTSADSVRHVEIPVRDEVLQTVPEESESAEVSMEMPVEGEISDTSFDVDESFNVESPLAKSTLMAQNAAAPSEVNIIIHAKRQTSP